MNTHDPKLFPSGVSIPPAALALGLLGLVPFLAGSLALLAGLLEMGGIAVFPALIGYGATVLAFLGGVHWGLAMRRPNPDERDRMLAIAVLPQLWGWAGLLVGGRIGLLALAIGLAACGLFDRSVLPHRGAPPWYPRLRDLLTIGAVALLLLAAVAV